MNAGSFLVTVKSQPDAEWKINGWEDDLIEATAIAKQLVERPYMAVTACVFQVGGFDALPAFTLKFQAKGQA
jgi:hypothetical protein